MRWDSFCTRIHLYPSTVRVAKDTAEWGWFFLWRCLLFSAYSIPLLCECNALRLLKCTINRMLRTLQSCSVYFYFFMNLGWPDMAGSRQAKDDPHSPNHAYHIPWRNLHLDNLIEQIHPFRALECSFRMGHVKTGI